MYNRPQGDEEAEVAVDKEWRIDGETYTHEDRPDGFEATLTLTGPGTDTATPQEWGEARGGYTIGDTATIAEDTTVPATCIVESSRVVSANATAVDEALPYTAQLTQAENTFTVRNTVSCVDEDEARLTLVKRVLNKHGGTAGPSDWTLTADGPEDLSGTSGSDEVTDVTVPSGTYTLGESDGPEGYRPSGWTCTGSAGEDVPVVNGQVALTPGDEVTCTLTNEDCGASPSPSPHPSPTWPGPNPTQHPGGGDHGGGDHAGGDHGGGELSHSGTDGNGPLLLSALGSVLLGSVLLLRHARRPSRG